MAMTSRIARSSTSLNAPRAQLAPGVSIAGIAQEYRAEQTPHVLNPRIHRHNA